jgi:hypothetical protein
MFKKFIFPILVTFFISTLLFVPAKSAFCSSTAADYLCELGVSFYQKGRYDDALMEFKKSLMLDANNPVARDYIDKIFKLEKPFLSASREPAKFKPMKEEPKEVLAREDTIGVTLDKLQKETLPQEEGKEKISGLKISGEARLGLGITSDDVIWKDANADKVGVPREKNWRYLWGDQRHNTYDPKIYDRLLLNMETRYDSPLNAFMEIDVDPWTFIGKNHVTITSTDGSDVVDMDLKYWSNDSRTINETYRSKKGNIINLKQIKVDDGKTTLITPTGLTNWGVAFNPIQPMEINRDYRPIRKLWFDYKQEDYAFKVFPISDEYEALTTDDPLIISNRHVYWEESPWLDEYEPSRIFEENGGLTPIKKGKWIRRLSFFTKDSSDDYPHRLTFLRGVSFTRDTGSYSLEATAATPMSLWDDYENSNSAEGALRLKIPLRDNLQLGFTTATKVGFNSGSAEAWNQVVATDVRYGLSEHKAIYGEIAGSHTDIQEAKGFDTEYNGLGAKLGFSYDALKEKREGICLGEIYLARMDDEFYPGLSNYRYTRSEGQPFSHHIYFAEIKEDDRSLIWGDGIDRGRNVIGLKLNLKSLNEKLDTDIKYRNVHQDSGKYIESVLRTESTYKVNPRLSTKLLGYYQHLPKTHANVDPIIYAKTMYALTDYFSDEDVHPINDSVIDDKDPSVGAFGFGAKYDLVQDLVSVEGIYERTNDTLDFPRGLLNDVFVTTEAKDGQVWDKIVPFLYDQKFFDMPPYHYYHIAKTRLIYTPVKEWEFILRYTFNENKHASGIDDNINHTALEINYMPTAKWTLWFKYIYSRLIDIYKQNKYQHSDFYEGHHNAFFGSEYRLTKDESFTLLYGEFVGYNDPYQQANWTLSALDTQHIFRIFYKREF